MPGCVVQVWFEEDEPGRDRRPGFDLVETEFEDFATFCEFVDADRLIAGAKLFVHRGEDPRERIVHATTPVAFRGSTVRRAQLPTWRIVREE